MQIVWITGTVWAGKGTVVEYMVKTMWFTHFSASGFISDELTRRGQELTRDNMRVLADGLRKEFWPSYIVDQLYKQAAVLWKNAIIESLRCVGEVQKLRQYSDFFLLWVDADKKTRYERAVKRWSTKDDVTYDQFVEQENREIHTTNPYEMNIVACLELADVIIRNDGTPEQLYLEVERALAI
jgi:dephospho-CoA kinase